MERQEELLNAVKSSGKGNEAQVRQLIDEIVFIEGQLVELKKYPFIAVHHATPKSKRQRRRQSNTRRCSSNIITACGSY